MVLIFLPLSLSLPTYLPNYLPMYLPTYKKVGPAKRKRMGLTTYLKPFRALIVDENSISGVPTNSFYNFLYSPENAINTSQMIMVPI